MNSAKYRKCYRVLVVLVLVVMLFSMFPVNVHAESIIEDKVDGLHSYSKYSIWNYQLDFYADSELSDLLPWNWGNLGSDTLGEFANFLSSALWTINCLISSFTGEIISEAFSLDIVTASCDKIGSAMQKLAGVTSEGISQNGFFYGFLSLFILILGIYVVYVGMVKQEASKALGAVVRSVAIFALSCAFIAYAPNMVEKLNDFSSELSNTALNFGTSLVTDSEVSFSTEKKEGENKGVSTMRDALFEVQIYKPWLILQYGTSDISSEEGLAERVTNLLSASPYDGDTRQGVVKKEVKEYENYNMSTPKAGMRLVLSLVLLLVNLVISIFVLLMCVWMWATQVMFIVYMVMLPMSMILSILPSQENLLTKSALKVLNAVLLRTGYTLVITIAFTISILLYDVLQSRALLTILIFQIGLFAFTYFMMHDILGMMQLTDSQKGKITKSLVRYGMMRSLFQHKTKERIRLPFIKDSKRPDVNNSQRSDNLLPDGEQSMIGDGSENPASGGSNGGSGGRKNTNGGKTDYDGKGSKANKGNNSKTDTNNNGKGKQRSNTDGTQNKGDSSQRGNKGEEDKKKTEDMNGKAKKETDDSKSRSNVDGKQNGEKSTAKSNIANKRKNDAKSRPNVTKQKPRDINSEYHESSDYRIYSADAAISGRDRPEKGNQSGTGARPSTNSKQPKNVKAEYHNDGGYRVWNAKKDDAATSSSLKDSIRDNSENTNKNNHIGNSGSSGRRNE